MNQQIEIRSGNRKMTIWQTRYILSGLLLGLSACSQLENPAQLEAPRCTICHTDRLAAGYVHDVHVDIVSPNDTMPGSEPIGGGETYDYDCTVCHLGYDISSQRVNARVHNNGQLNITFDSTYFKTQFQFTEPAYFVDQTCYNMPCHGAGFADSSGEGARGIVWHPDVAVDDTLGCNGCHDATQHMGSHDCQICHEETAGDGNSIKDFSKHINGMVEVNF